MQAVLRLAVRLASRAKSEAHMAMLALARLTRQGVYLPTFLRPYVTHESSSPSRISQIGDPRRDTLDYLTPGTAYVALTTPSQRDRLSQLTHVGIVPRDTDRVRKTVLFVSASGRIIAGASRARFVVFRESTNFHRQRGNICYEQKRVGPKYSVSGEIDNSCYI